ncbi:MAG TPA: 50S ribosomal protein L22 [Candidatus Paceibacterota bacterium]|jgi:ribosomal protein L22, bacterial type
MVTASLHNYRQSPRKVRLVATLIKGKTVDQALNMLGVTVKRASDPIAKLLLSAVANAKDRNVNTDGFVVLECTVNQGYTMRRMMPGARGSGFPIRKKTSHVKLVIGPKASKKAAKAAPVEKAAKTTK